MHATRSIALTAALTMTTISATNAAEPSGFVQYDYGHASLTDGFADWNDHGLRVHTDLTPDDALDVELSRQDHFNDQGTFAGVSYRRVLDDRWFASINVGGSSGGFFLPRIRYDGFINRKWLESRRLVTTLGFSYIAAKDGHIDRTLLMSGQYYFASPWIFEGGVKINRSAPGDVTSHRGYIAVTEGRDKDHYLVARIDVGREAYQIIGSGQAISDFSSEEASLTWRHWWTRDFGTNVVASHYRNPNYKRSGLQAGIFYAF